MLNSIYIGEDEPQKVFNALFIPTFQNIMLPEIKLRNPKITVVIINYEVNTQTFLLKNELEIFGKISIFEIFDSIQETETKNSDLIQKYLFHDLCWNKDTFQNLDNLFNFIYPILKIYETNDTYLSKIKKDKLNLFLLKLLQFSIFTISSSKPENTKIDILYLTQHLIVLHAYLVKIIYEQISTNDQHIQSLQLDAIKLQKLIDSFQKKVQDLNSKHILEHDDIKMNSLENKINNFDNFAFMFGGNQNMKNRFQRIDELIKEKKDTQNKTPQNITPQNITSQNVISQNNTSQNNIQSKKIQIIDEKEIGNVVSINSFDSDDNKFEAEQEVPTVQENLTLTNDKCSESNYSAILNL